MDNKQQKNQNTADDMDISNNTADYDDLGMGYEGVDEGALGGQATSGDIAQNDQSQSGRGNQGFSKMKKENPGLQKEYASQGGKKAHENGTAHEWDSQEAKDAGKIGGSK
jgi:hypothetical protein